jgi:Uma2 family endonuclease
MAITLPITTAAQLLHAEGLGRCELVRGELVMMTPAGFEHGRIVISLSTPLASFVKGQSLGVVTGAETGFQIARDPDTVRAPDVAFIRAERVPPSPLMGFFPGAPDLAVEVVSPSDRATELLSKVQNWLEAGCRAVWVIDPLQRTVSIYRTDKPMAILHASDVLSGDDVVPGFSVPVAEIFAR